MDFETPRVTFVLVWQPLLATADPTAAADLLHLSGHLHRAGAYHQGVQADHLHCWQAALVRQPGAAGTVPYLVR
jgi:hypothetical protein